MLAAILLTGITRASRSAKRISCQNNLKQIGLSLLMYSSESRNGLYPPLKRFTSLDYDASLNPVYAGRCSLPNPPRDGVPFHGTLDWPAVYPEYIPSVVLNVCPSDLNRDVPLDTGLWHEDANGDGVGDIDAPIDSCAVTSESYAYIAWAVDSWTAYDDPASVLSPQDYIFGLADLIQRRPTEGPDVYDEDIDGFLAAQDIRRLRKGIHRFYVTDVNNKSTIIESRMPVLFDLVSVDIQPFNHVPGGANVLFVDGHCEFVTYPGRFPVSEDFANVAEFFGA